MHRNQTYWDHRLQSGLAREWRLVRLGVQLGFLACGLEQDMRGLIRLVSASRWCWLWGAEFRLNAGPFWMWKVA